MVCMFPVRKIKLWLILLLIFGPSTVLTHLCNPGIVPGPVSCQTSPSLISAVTQPPWEVVLKHGCRLGFQGSFKKCCF